MARGWPLRGSRQIALISLSVLAFSFGYHHCQAMPDPSHSCCRQTVLAPACCAMPTAYAGLPAPSGDILRRADGLTPLSPAIFGNTEPVRQAYERQSGTHLRGPPSRANPPFFIVFHAFLE
ncbi:MAG: hypothetical protein V2G51_06350 [bacterium JZ-2024 1]